MAPGSSNKGKATEEGPDSVSIGSFKDFAQEYSEAAEALSGELPPGSVFPKQVPGRFETDATFEEGAGTMQAAFVLQCEWLLEYSNAVEQGDNESRGRALDHLEDWIRLPAVAKLTDADSSSAWLETAIAPARDGKDNLVLALAKDCGK